MVKCFFFPSFFFFKPSTVQLPSLEEISFVQDFFQICHRRELKVFILRHFTNHSRRGTLSFYHLSLIRKKKMLISSCILFWGHNSQFQFSVLDWELVHHPKTLGGSSALTAHIISLCLLSCSFHLASIAFVFLLFFFKQWKLSSETHTANYNSCHL